MSTQANLWDLPSVISSQESACGAMHSDSPDGRMTEQSGPEAALVPPSQSLAKERGLQTLVTSGRYGSILSASVDLERSLVSRLMERLDMAGSTLFQATWKRKATPLRRRYWAHIASALPTADTGCTSVPTPNSGPQNDSDSTWEQRREALKEQHKNGNGFGLTLGMATSLAAVPSPCTPNGGRSMSTQAMDATGYGEDLAIQAANYDPGVDPDGSIRSRLDQLPRQAQLAASGLTATGGTAETKSTGQLDPEYSRWLMGLPPEWSSCAVTAMASFRKARRIS